MLNDKIFTIYSNRCTIYSNRSTVYSNKEYYILFLPNILITLSCTPVYKNSRHFKLYLFSYKFLTLIFSAIFNTAGRGPGGATVTFSPVDSLLFF